MRIALAELPASGHVNPTLPVIGELVGRGHAVTALVTPPFRAAVQGAGAAFADIGPALGDLDVEHPPTGLADTAALLARATARLIPALVEMWEDERPDVVVHDAMAPWGRHAADLLGIPRVCSNATFVLHPGTDRSLAGAADVLREVAHGRRAVPAYRHAARAVRERDGVRLGPPAAMFDSRAGAPTIVYTSRSMQPGAGALGPEVHFVGPRLAGPGDGAPDLPPGPLLYVALGTLFNERPDFFRACIDALGAGPRPLVLAVGAAVDPGDLGPLPPGVHVRAHVDQFAVLERADVFITHCGMNSVHEALTLGVPLVLFPQAADQPLVARRVAALGAGVRLRGRLPDAAAIRAAVAAASAPPVRAAAARLGADLRAGGGAAQAADVVEAAAHAAPAASA